MDRENPVSGAESSAAVQREGQSSPSLEEHELRETVRSHYSRAARRAADGEVASCCGSSKGTRTVNPISRDLYPVEDMAGAPEAALRASLGCGNPLARAELRPGEVVLDLGSGGGIDVILSAHRVAPSGKAYGLDMTEEMIELARRNQREAGVENAEFLLGQIEEVPLPDDSVDVILSNCVINLSADKDRVFREAHRVLRAGGRLAIADIVVEGAFPDALRQVAELWAGCLGGALEKGDYRRRLEAAGFEEVRIETTRLFGLEDLSEEDRHEVEAMGLSTEVLEGRLVSAFVHARKPRRRRVAT